MTNCSIAWRRTAAVLIVLPLFVDCAIGPAAEDREEPLAQQQELVQSLLARVTPAVVAIRFDDRYDSSGVIVSESGLMLTHGHHNLSVVQEESRQVLENRKVPVVLSDGRTVTGRVLAVHSSDNVEYSLLKITTEGKWPHVEVAGDHCPQRGDWCLHLGHPLGYQRDRLPVPRLGQIVAANESRIASSCMCVPGDSGGPLFDREGRVIGIATGMYGLRCHRASLHANAAILTGNLLRLEERDPKGNRTVSAVLVETRPPSPLYREVARNAHDFTVQVYCDDASRVLGTIVSREGWVVTKRSELSGKLACQLVDGQRVAARLMAEAPDFDVSLLKLDSGPAADPPWRREQRCVRGEIVASIGMTPDPIAISIIGDARVQAVPAVRGSFRLGVEPTADGFRVTEFHPSDLPYAECDIREGDLVLNIDGRDFKTVAEWDDFWNHHPPTAGHPISLLVRRQGQSRVVRTQCPPNGHDWLYMADKASELSPRRSGFPAVVVHDAVLTRGQCGGPVVDISGKIVGINIARAARHATYTIPTRTVLELTQRLGSSQR